MKKIKIIKITFLTLTLSLFLMSFTPKTLTKSFGSKSISEYIMDEIFGNAVAVIDTTGPDSGCPKDNSDSLALSEKIITSLPDNSKLYEFRDKYLKQTIRGVKYVDQYYYAGSVIKDYTKLSRESLVDIVTVVPLIISSYENMMDNSYSGIIVDDELGAKFETVLNAFKPLSSDSKYTTIINDLLVDIKTVTGKDKSYLTNFMNNK